MVHDSLVSGTEILDIDEYVVENVGIPSIVLMENAGLAVVNYIIGLDSHPRSAAIVCGTGNNGADGLVVARKLTTLGIYVEVFIVSTSGSSVFKSNEGKMNAALAFDKFAVPVQKDPPAADRLKNFDVIIDAVLGAGTKIQGSFPPLFQATFDAINSARAHVVAVDVPSGICPTTGNLVCERPVRAHATITFGLVKSGLIFYPGATYVGQLVLSTISYPANPVRELMTKRRIHFRINPVPSLSARDPLGHKGTFGKATFFAGSGNYFGAPLFCSLSFLKAGGGYSRLFCNSTVASVVAVSAPEVVQLGDVWMEAIQVMTKRDTDIVLLGPGIGLHADYGMKIFNSVLEAMPESRCKAIVIDGDALTILSSDPDWKYRVKKILQNNISVVLTPHVGELRKLFPSIVTGSELDNITQTKQVLGSSDVPGEADLVVVVKGARTGIVSWRTNQCFVNVTGNHGMGTCGSGDVLAGTIAALTCSTSSCVQSAVAGAVFIHGLAGDIAAQSLGPDGITATDIMNSVALAINQVRNNNEELRTKYFPRIV